MTKLTKISDNTVKATSHSTIIDIQMRLVCDDQRHR